MIPWKSINTAIGNYRIINNKKILNYLLFKDTNREDKQQVRQAKNDENVFTISGKYAKYPKRIYKIIWIMTVAKQNAKNDNIQKEKKNYQNKAMKNINISFNNVKKATITFNRARNALDKTYFFSNMKAGKKINVNKDLMSRHAVNKWTKFLLNQKMVALNY